MTSYGFLRRLLILIAALVSLSACRQRGTPVPNQPEGMIVDVEIDPTLALPTNVVVEEGRELLPPVEMTTEMLHAQINPLVENVEACVLPCYLGLQMGSSDQLDVYNFYSGLGIGIADLIPGDYQAAQDGEGHLRAWLTRTTDVARAGELGLAPPQVAVTLEGGVAQSLAIRWDYLPAYLTSSTIIDALGMPDAVNIGLRNARLESPPTVYLLELHYAALQTSFLFFPVPQGDASAVTLCPSSDEIARTDFGVAAEEGRPLADEIEATEMVPIDVAGLDADAILAALQGGSECVEFPAAQWSPWLPAN